MVCFGLGSDRVLRGEEKECELLSEQDEQMQMPRARPRKQEINGGHAPRGCLKASPSKTKRVTVKAKRHVANEHGLKQPDKFIIMVNCDAVRKH